MAKNLRDITQVEEITELKTGDKLLINANGVAKLYDIGAFREEEEALFEEFSEISNSKQDKLPEITAADVGKFLRVNENGVWEVVALKAAEEVVL